MKTDWMHMALKALVAIGIAFETPGLATVPPLPPPAPERLAAARILVASLPIEESIASRSPIQTHPARNAVVENLVQSWTYLHPEENLTPLMAFIRPRVESLIDQQMPAITPSALEEIAIVYAYSLQADELRSGAAFFSTQNGRPFATWIVSQDSVIRRVFGTKLFEAVRPGFDSIVTQARESERLRERINAAR